MYNSINHTEHGSALHHFLIHHLFRCPECSSRDLAFRPGSLCCNRCHQYYPIFNGVIDFFFRALQESDSNPETQVDDEFIRELIAKVMLEPSNENETNIREILVRAEGKKGREELAESTVRSLAQRFGIEVGKDLSRQFYGTGAGTPHQSNLDLLYRFEKHYIPDHMTPGTLYYRNVRIRNTGDYPWSPSGPHPTCLRYRWHSVSDGSIVVEEGEGTKFPVEIHPSQAISLPLKILSPSLKGDFLLEIFPEQDCLRTGKNKLCVPVMVKEAPELCNDLPLTENPDQYSYSDDHALAFTLLNNYIGKNYQKKITVMEIGGGCHPQTAWLPDCWMVNLDISLPLLEMGCLFFKESGKENVIFTCANGMDPPFAPRSFDAIIIFSSLHHFPEPDRLLSRLRDLLSHGGFIGIFCEPLNNTLEHPEIIRELNIGISEQVFSLDEYLMVFGYASLCPEMIQIDGGSLKAILKKA